MTLGERNHRGDKRIVIESFTLSVQLNVMFLTSSSISFLTVFTRLGTPTSLILMPVLKMNNLLYRPLLYPALLGLRCLIVARITCLSISSPVR